MFEKFTDAARRVVVLAQEEARMLGHGHIGSEHLLLALVHETDGVAGEVFASMGVVLGPLRRQVLDAGGEGRSSTGGQIPFTPEAKGVLEGALRASRLRGDQHVGTAHLLLSLLEVPHGVAARILPGMGVDLSELEQQVVAARIHHRERFRMGGLTPSPAPPATQELTPAALDVQRILRAVASFQPVRSYHYLLALFDDSSSVAARVLASFGLDREIVQQRITEIGTEGTTDEFPSTEG